MPRGDMSCCAGATCGRQRGRRWGACGFVGVSASASARVRMGVYGSACGDACVRAYMYGCSLRSATGSLHVCMCVGDRIRRPRTKGGAGRSESEPDGRGLKQAPSGV